MKPVIGIAANPRTLETEFGPTLLHTASRYYVRAVERAGGTPIILPVTEPGNVLYVLRVCDGVIFAGGGDIQPSLYGAPPHDSTRMVNPERDSFEIMLFEEAVAASVPLLAICRGLQVMNVAMGGTLIQDMFAATGVFHDDYTRAFQPVHGVKVEPSSRLADALGVAELWVNSVHHQGIARLGSDLRAVAWADDDSVEGLELEGASYAVGVQWHPEVLEDQPEQQGLFRELVREARVYGERIEQA